MIQIAISGAWWVLVFLVIGLVAASITSMRADQGGSHALDWGDWTMGCLVPMVELVACLFLGMLLWALGVRMVVG